MLWVFLAISAHFFWALANVADKYIVSNRVKNPYFYQIWLALISVIYLLLIPFVDFDIPRLDVLLWLISAAGLFLFGSFPYIKAMQIEEATRINVLWNLIPIFSFFLGWWLIGENLSAKQIIAFILLIFGSIIASLHIRKNNFVFSRAFLLMVLSCFLYSGYAVILRYISTEINFISSFIWLNLLMIIFIPVLLINNSFRHDFFKITKNLNRSFIGILFLVLLIGDLALLLNIWALSLGPVALVFAMEGWQVIFVFAMTIIISIFRPKLLKEDLGAKNMVLKLLALVIIVIGVVMVYIS